MEAPALGRLQREFGRQGVQVVAINISPYSSLPEWKDFWSSLGADDVLWATDTDQKLVRLYQVLSLGTTIIIDRQGHVSYRDGGATTYEVLLSQVRKLI